MKTTRPLTSADFENVCWQEAIITSDESECFSYCSAFASRAMKAANSGDQIGHAAFDLLRKVTLAAVNSEPQNEPFLEDWLLSFSDHEVALLAELASGANDAEVRARLADIVWERKHDAAMARLAVDAYIQSASILHQQDCWVGAHVRMARAANIGRKLGANSQHFQRAIDEICRFLNSIRGNDDSFFSAFLMETLQHYGRGDGVTYGTFSKIAAERALRARDWERARRYLFIEAHWYFFSNRIEMGTQTRLRMVETYVEEAAEMVATTSQVRYSQACHRIERALKGYQDIAGSTSKERRDELYRLLREYQKEAQKELTAFSPPVSDDCLDELGATLADQYIQVLKSKSLLEAVRIMACLPLVQNIAITREPAERFVRKSPVALMFPLMRLSSAGRVSGRPPVKPCSEEEQIEAEIEAHMFSDACEVRIWKTRRILLPVIEAIKREHHVRLEDAKQIVVDSPFVPIGREHIFASAIHSVFSHNYLIAAHLLIPEIEHALRCLLNCQEKKTSGFNRQDVQDYYDLNAMLLKRKDLELKLTSILGIDIVFELKGLLVHRFGANLRNELAHGTLGANELNSDFYGLQLIYLCWLAVRLCFTNLMILENAKRAAAS